MSLVTTVSVASSAVSASGTSVGQADVSGVGTLVLQVGSVSPDILGLNQPSGANMVGCNMLDPAPTAGSVQEKLIYFNQFAYPLRFASPNQVTYSVDINNAVVLGLPQDIAPASSPAFLDVTMRKVIGQHLKGVNPSSGGPRIVSWGTGAGADQTPTAVVVGGHDIQIRLSFTTSATPASAQTIAQIAFASQFDVAPTVIPVGLNAVSRALLASAGGPAAASVTTGGFGFSAVAALTAGTAYSFAFNITAG